MGTCCAYVPPGEADVQEEPLAAEEDADMRLSQLRRLEMMRSERWRTMNDPQRPEMESEPVTTAENPYKEEEQPVGEERPLNRLGQGKRRNYGRPLRWFGQLPRRSNNWRSCV